MDNIAWKKVQIAREKDRPTALDYIENIFDEFIEFHGDRDYAEDGAIVCGIASLNNVNYTIIAEQKGRDTKENIKRNFEMQNPESYKKLLELRDIVKQYEEKYNKHIPVISAGGIFDRKDIVKALKYGADGVQIATKFVVTKECDADIKFKEAYVRAKKEDIIIIKSPIGKPGRTIKNHFLENLKDYKLTKCFNCIKTCDRKTIPYCITQALINSVTGNIDNGLIFCGSNVDRIDKITDLKTVISELIKEANENYE